MKNHKFNTKMIVNVVMTLIVTMSMSLYSQDTNQMSRISLGFNVASMNSFTNNNLNSGNSNDLYVSYAFNSALALNLGYNTSAYTKKTLNVNQSVLHSGLLIGVDYFLKPRHEFLSSSLNLSLVNSFTSFEDLKNSHVDLSYRLNFYKTFYLGLGANYTHNNIPEFSTIPLDNLNLMLQIGIRGIGFKFGRK